MNNITDTTHSPFDLLSNELTANILSFVDVKDHGSVAQVSMLFNDIVNSGVEEGKNAREYLLGKIGNIDFTFPIDKFINIYINTFPASLNSSQRESFNAKILEISAPAFPAIQDNFKKVALDNINKFLSQDDEITNLKLAQFVQDPNSQKSQAFVKDLALKTLEKFLSITERENREELAVLLPKLDK
ncbi:MAG: hypothetical protein K1000chlam2_00743 [Chlamydiae bacterium]|nr:hypothetical protein [Chlamydiota bacterium]